MACPGSFAGPRQVHFDLVTGGHRCSHGFGRACRLSTFTPASPAASARCWSRVISATFAAKTDLDEFGIHLADPGRVILDHLERQVVSQLRQNVQSPAPTGAAALVRAVCQALQLTHDCLRHKQVPVRKPDRATCKIRPSTTDVSTTLGPSQNDSREPARCPARSPRITAPRVRAIRKPASAEHHEEGEQRGHHRRGAQREQRQATSETPTIPTIAPVNPATTWSGGRVLRRRSPRSMLRSRRRLKTPPRE